MRRFPDFLLLRLPRGLLRGARRIRHPCLLASCLATGVLFVAFGLLGMGPERLALLRPAPAPLPVEGAEDGWAACDARRAAALAELAGPPPPGHPLALHDDNGDGGIRCAEARRHGIAPVMRGDPAYPFACDRDGDGRAC